jgi:hypothetical protein
MTAPERPSKAGLDPNARGIIVLVVVVVVAIVLLSQAGGGTSGASAPTTTAGVTTTGQLGGTTTTSLSGTTTSTTTSGGTPHPVSSVKVVVLNGSGKSGAAGAATATIKAKGYTMGAPSDAAASVKGKPTTVYYATGYEADASQVAGILGKSTTEPKPAATTLGPGAQTANLVVVLGSDTAPADGSTTSTTRRNGSGTTTTTSSSGTKSTTTTSSPRGSGSGSTTTTTR